MTNTGAECGLPRACGQAAVFVSQSHHPEASQARAVVHLDRGSQVVLRLPDSYQSSGQALTSPTVDCERHRSRVGPVTSALPNRSARA